MMNILKYLIVCMIIIVVLMVYAQAQTTTPSSQQLMETHYFVLGTECYNIWDNTSQAMTCIQKKCEKESKDADTQEKCEAAAMKAIKTFETIKKYQN